MHAEEPVRLSREELLLLRDRGVHAHGVLRNNRDRLLLAEQEAQDARSAVQESLRELEQVNQQLQVAGFHDAGHLIGALKTEDPYRHLNGRRNANH